jgi:dCMP deaminase
MEFQRKLKWDKRMVGLAEHIAQWSKDPSTKVGAVIVDDKNRVAGHGYNGFPRGVDDDCELYEDRDQKYPRVVHAELNAILNSRGSVEGCTIYVSPLAPCAECAKAIIQAGISRVIISSGAARSSDRWNESTKVGWEMMDQTGISVEYIGQEDGPP